MPSWEAVSPVCADPARQLPSRSCHLALQRCRRALPKNFPAESRSGHPIVSCPADQGPGSRNLNSTTMSVAVDPSGDWRRRSSPLQSTRGHRFCPEVGVEVVVIQWWSWCCVGCGLLADVVVNADVLVCPPSTRHEAPSAPGRGGPCASHRQSLGGAVVVEEAKRARLR